MSNQSRKAKAPAEGKEAEKAPDRNCLRIEVLKGAGVSATPERQVAAAVLRPSVKGGLTLSTWRTDPFEVGVTELVDELAEQGKIAAGGDLSRLEAMMAIQAHTLDGLFNQYAQLARKNLGQYLDASETFMRLALKAQSQCRATVETLAAVKNPPAVAFVKQANIANGHQQVNNGRNADARGNQFSPNELLEGTHERLEHSTSPATGFGNSKVATVGAVNGASDNEREGNVKPE